MEAAEYRNGMWPAEGPNIVCYGLGWGAVNAYPFSSYGLTVLTRGGDTQLNTALCS